MSVREVTYYEVVCDGCGRSTGDIDEMFTAWSDRDAATEQWVDYFGLIAEPFAFCAECYPRCACGRAQDEDEGHPFFCEDCNPDEAARPERLNAALRRYQPPGDSRHQIDVLTGRPLSDEDNQ